MLPMANPETRNPNPACYRFNFSTLYQALYCGDFSAEAGFASRVGLPSSPAQRAVKKHYSALEVWR